jgi:hypothetical protein
MTATSNFPFLVSNAYGIGMRDSNFRIWESDPLHSLSHKHGFDTVRWSPAKVSPATFHRDAQVRMP